MVFSGCHQETPKQTGRVAEIHHVIQFSCVQGQGQETEIMMAQIEVDVSTLWLFQNSKVLIMEVRTIGCLGLT